MRALNAVMQADSRLDCVLLPVGDGLSVARKR
jgi:predicted O-methyltransferase YrrM